MERFLAGKSGATSTWWHDWVRKMTARGTQHGISYVVGRGDGRRQQPLSLCVHVTCSTESCSWQVLTFCRDKVRVIQHSRHSWMGVLA